jgi:hypothetical protein
MEYCLMPVALNGSTSGSVTLTAPAIAGTTTLTFPATTGTINASGTANEVPAGSAAAPSIYSTGDTNTGIFFSAADTIDFTEGGVATGQFDSSGNFKFNSGYGSAAVAYGCRAWVNFNGTGTVAIRGSGNVTSVTDNGTGRYTVNFTTAMPDINYSANVSTSGEPGVSDVKFVNTDIHGATGVAPTVSALALTTANFGSTTADSTYIRVSVFR